MSPKSAQSHPKVATCSLLGNRTGGQFIYGPQDDLFACQPSGDLDSHLSVASQPGELSLAGLFLWLPAAICLAPFQRRFSFISSDTCKTSCALSSPGCL